MFQIKNKELRCSYKETARKDCPHLKNFKPFRQSLTTTRKFVGAKQQIWNSDCMPGEQSNWKITAIFPIWLSEIGTIASSSKTGVLSLYQRAARIFFYVIVYPMSLKDSLKEWLYWNNFCMCERWIIIKEDVGFYLGIS